MTMLDDVVSRFFHDGNMRRQFIKSDEGAKVEVKEAKEQMESALAVQMLRHKDWRVCQQFG